jgi:hypothetical protein
MRHSNPDTSDGSTIPETGMLTYRGILCIPEDRKSSSRNCQSKHVARDHDRLIDQPVDGGQRLERVGQDLTPVVIAPICGGHQNATPWPEGNIG